MTIERPEAPEDLDAGWLTGTLRESGVIDEACVTAFETTIIGQDRGFTGVVARLKLTYDRDEPGALASLVAKFPLAARATGSSYRESVSAGPAGARAYLERCAREVSFYRLIAGGGAYAPRAIVAEADLEAGWICLLLEDLSHGEPGDAVYGCSPEQAGFVLDQIAEVHAAWWGDPALDMLDWLPVWSGGGTAAAERLRARVNPFLARYGDEVPAGVHELLRLFASRFETVLQPLTEPPMTVIHGDLHLDNIMFVTGDGTQAVRIIDWQGVSRGPAALDVALFLVGSLSVESRRESEAQLLRRYHQKLVDAGVHGYDFDLLLDHYRRALLYQLAGTVGWLSRTSPEDLEGRERELIEAILTKGQLFVALVDHQEGLRPLLGIY